MTRAAEAKAAEARSLRCRCGSGCARPQPRCPKAGGRASHLTRCAMLAPEVPVGARRCQPTTASTPCRTASPAPLGAPQISSPPRPHALILPRAHTHTRTTASHGERARTRAGTTRCSGRMRSTQSSPATPKRTNVTAQAATAQAATAQAATAVLSTVSSSSREGRLAASPPPVVTTRAAGSHRRQSRNYIASPLRRWSHTTRCSLTRCSPSTPTARMRSAAAVVGLRRRRAIAASLLC